MLAWRQAPCKTPSTQPLIQEIPYTCSLAVTEGHRRKGERQKPSQENLSNRIQPSFLEVSVGLRKQPLCRHLFESGPGSTSNLIQVSEHVLRSKVSRLRPIYTGLETMISRWKALCPVPWAQCRSALWLFFSAGTHGTIFSWGHLHQTGRCSGSSCQRIYYIDLGNKVNWNELWVFKVGLAQGFTIKMEFFSFQWLGLIWLLGQCHLEERQAQFYNMKCSFTFLLLL